VLEDAVAKKQARDEKAQRASQLLGEVAARSDEFASEGVPVAHVIGFNIALFHIGVWRGGPEGLPRILGLGSSGAAIGIPSQKVGPTCTICANPVNFVFVP
jgi:hypothetical protein